MILIRMIQRVRKKVQKKIQQKVTTQPNRRHLIMWHRIQHQVLMKQETQLQQ